MNDFVDLTGKKQEATMVKGNASLEHMETKSKVPRYELLQSVFDQQRKLVDDIVLKNYLTKLTEFEIGVSIIL